MSTENSLACGVHPSRDRVFDEVRHIVAESAGIAPDEIQGDDMLLRDLPWDSLDLVECTMEIEEHFDINVPDDLVDHAKTVGDIVDGILTLLAQPQASD
jgi:acyl carrier protein